MLKTKVTYVYVVEKAKDFEYIEVIAVFDSRSLARSSCESMFSTDTGAAIANGWETDAEVSSLYYGGITYSVRKMVLHRTEEGSTMQ